jgi:hypothetical protein
VNEVSFSSQDSLLRVCKIPRELAHPQSVRHLRVTRNLHLSRTQVDEEDHKKPSQSSPCPHFHGDEIGSHTQLPMSAQEFLPSPLSLRRGLEPMPFENVRYRTSGKFAPDVGLMRLGYAGSSNPDSLLPSAPPEPRYLSQSEVAPGNNVPFRIQCHFDKDTSE